jgi:hypothetical protein
LALVIAGLANRLAQRNDDLSLRPVFSVYQHTGGIDLPVGIAIAICEVEFAWRYRYSLGVFVDAFSHSGYLTPAGNCHYIGVCISFFAVPSVLEVRAGSLLGQERGILGGWTLARVNGKWNG